MLYDMRCDVCKRDLEIGCPITQHEDIIKPGITCSEDILQCHGMLRQVIVSPRHMFLKESFPATGNELQLPTDNGVDIKFQDKYHARDYLEGHGLMSKWIENDM